VRIASIRITNMAAFESFETKLPTVALVQGRNGAGKTSLLDCLKYAFGRGHDEDLIHGDAPEGEILIEFDNGAAVKCRAVRERHETIRSWRAPGSKRFVVSREQIDAISNAISYDPLSFLDKREDEQIETLLRIMPVPVPHEEIASIVPSSEHDLVQQIPERLNGLEVIDYWHKHLYQKRRELNVAADTQSKHAAELEKSLPPEAPGADWQAEVRRLEAEKERIEKKQAEQLAEIARLFEQEKEEAQREYNVAVEAAMRARDERLEAARRQANQTASQVKQQNSPALSEVLTQLGTAQERARAAAQTEGTRKALEAARAAAAKNKAESEKLTAALEGLEKLKAEVAKRLPIPGTTIQEGRIWREENGKMVPFSRWNTESKIRFCLRIAVLAHGDAGFICIDNAEHFDSAKRMALVETAAKYAEKDGLQFLIASVSDQPLTVKEA
jgi:DNA repair exonuclease SbcCD ATPase subunit